MNTRRTLASALLLTLGLATAPVLAQGGMGGPGMGYGMGVPGMGYGMGYGMGGPGMGMGYGMGGMPCGLMGMSPGWGAGAELNDEQRQQIAALQQELHQAQWQQMQELHSLHAGAMMSGGEPDKAAILDLHRKMSEIHLKMLEQRLDTQEKIRAIVGPR